MFGNLFGGKKAAPQMHPAQEAGFVLAAGLGWACIHRDYGDDVRSWMETADVPVPIMWRELGCLLFFGGDWAIFELLNGHADAAVFRRGYIEGMKDFGTKGRANAEILETFDQRAPGYAKAAGQGGRIEDAFTGFVAESLGINMGHAAGSGSQELVARIGHLSVLSAFAADAEYTSGYVAAGNLMAERGLIKAPG